MPETILIVEDETALAAIVSDYVKAAGYEAVVIANGQDALASIKHKMPTLIVLDLMLPGMDGLSLCTVVRSFSEVPIIMVTARVQEIDRLLGLETGADDYVCKPFSPRELLARIKAVLRRYRGSAEGAQIVHIDEPTRAVRVRNQLVDLTPTEFNLFAAMVRRPGVIYSRAQLLDLADRDNAEATDRVIDSHIRNLRKKLAAAYPDAELIHSVYGLGYRFEL